MRDDGLVGKSYNNPVMKEYIKGTKAAALDPLFVGDNFVIFGHGIDQLPTLLRHIKNCSSWLMFLFL